MAALHTVNKSPFERNTFASCLRVAKSGSAVLLLEDGVYASLKGTEIESQMIQALQRHAVYALESDLQARGIAPGRVVDGVRMVDYGGFVDLVVEHEKVVAWL